MENNTKKGLIAAGIIALLVWYSKRAKPTETPTEEPSGGGGGGGAPFPMITPLPVPVAIVTTKATTPSNLSPSLKNAGVVQNAGTAPIIPKINTSTGLPTGVGGGIANTGYNPATNTTTSTAMNESVKCPNNKIYSVSSADIKSSGGSTSWCQRNGHYAGSANFVGFDGKIIRPSYKVDFF